MYVNLSEKEEGIGKQVVDIAYHIHKYLGPGLLESVYQSCMQEEFKYRELPNKSQMIIPIGYRDIVIDRMMYRDLLMVNCQF